MSYVPDQYYHNINILDIYLYWMKYNFTKNILNFVYFFISKFIKWARLNSPAGRFRPLCHMFDIPALSETIED